ncbi:hypothetical protein [Streptomyces echinatus]|uniref:hypothetical protein n=1 Tax=Streptomyces echinatus TaxID=67293 RepID=UPI00379FE9E7
MTDEKDHDVVGYLEDVYVTDVGLTWVASRWSSVDMFEREPDRHPRPEGGPVAEWLGFAALAVDEFDRSRAVQLDQDVQRLLRSPLTEDTILTVWLGATHGLFDPVEYGVSARTWLERVEETWLTRVRQDDPAFVPPSPQPVVDEGLVQAVLQMIRPVAEQLTHAAENPPYGTSVTCLAPALERVVTEACADLGYRLFLRAMKAYLVPADGPALIALGERFGYPHGIVREGLNDRTG